MSRPVVLVSGGAGFIGSNVVDGLLADGSYQVRVLDSFATGRRENLSHCFGAIETVEGDMRDVETVEEAVDGVWAVLHQAALPSVPRSIKSPVTTSDVNIGGTLKLLSAARRAGVEKVVFASSSSVYGETADLPKVETMTPQPVSPYAVTKLCAEHYCRVFHELYGVQTVALRYFNVFGPRQDPSSQYSGVIPRFITAALNDTVCVVHGDGSQTRDFSYVENIVRANLLALKTDRLHGGAVNIACGRRVSLNTMLVVLGEIAGRQMRVEYAPRRPGDVEHSEAAIGLAQEVLHYEPVVHLKEGLTRTMAWYAEQAGIGSSVSAGSGA